MVGRETRESNAQVDGVKKQRDLGKNGKVEGKTGLAGEKEEGALGLGELVPMWRERKSPLSNKYNVNLPEWTHVGT